MSLKYWVLIYKACQHFRYARSQLGPQCLKLINFYKPQIIITNDSKIPKKSQSKIINK